jgi:hypothetical protein
MTIPTKLYKYRKFDVTALKMLVGHETFYADPKSFNDPIDCNPAFDFNISLKELIELCLETLAMGNRVNATKRIRDIVYQSSEYGDYKTEVDARRFLIQLLVDDIGDTIKEQFGAMGVLSFAADWASPLMWSHYADDHKGICIEFDTTEVTHSFLAPVNYDASRKVKLSDIFDWKVKGNNMAETNVFNTYFYSKAADWSYENEWRDINLEAGVTSGRYRVTGIYFGLRCEYAVKVAIVKMLAGNSKIQLRTVALRDDDFTLTSFEDDRDEIEALGMRPPTEIMMQEMVAGLEDITVPPPIDIEASLTS